MQFAHRHFQGLVVGGIDRINAGKHHWLNFFVSCQRFGAGAGGIGHSIADFYLSSGFHVGDDVAYIAGDENICGSHFRSENADFFYLVVVVRGEQFDFLATFDCARKHSHIGNYAAIGIVKRVKNGPAQEFIRVLGRMWHACDDGFENLADADAIFGRSWDCVFGGNCQNIFELLAAFRHIGSGEVDFIKNRDDGEVLQQREVQVSYRLRLHALRGIDPQHRAFAGGQSS